MIFTQDHPDEKNSGKYYDSDEYASHHGENKNLLNRIYRIARVMMLSRKRRLIRKITGKDTGKLLDIGSGSGHFLFKMKKSGWDVYGIEINDSARNTSINNFSLNVLSPDKLSSFHNESFDCITLWHVLEHFQDPFSYSYHINRLLKPGGICIVAIPNCSSYDALYYGAHWAAYDVPRHLWHFNPDTFKMFSEKAGLYITSIRNLPLDVYYISALSEKYKGTKTQLISCILKGGYFSFLTLFNKHKSSSLIYFLRK